LEEAKTAVLCAPFALAFSGQQSGHGDGSSQTEKGANMAQAVGAAIEQLRRLKVSALRKRYQEILGEESRSSNKQFLFRRIAWRLQANAEGGLSERARHRAEHIVQDADLRTRAPKEFLPAEISVDATATVDRTQAGRDQRLPPPGTL